MDEKKLLYNLKKFKKYNQQRHGMFLENSPREASCILYTLPLLLAVNHPKIPGYIQDSNFVFNTYGLDESLEFKKRKEAFCSRFALSLRELFFSARKVFYIEGLYTIGSTGTIAQTIDSDCDIWIVCDSENIGKEGWRVLQQKINIIKDWLDLNFRIPVYFFLSDVKSIQRGIFGKVLDESSGSAQKNVLKEEFYRTCMIILGKVPFWWLCFDKEKELDYNKSLEKFSDIKSIADEFVDLGNLESVSLQEFFGAALWQLHKSLSSPLKSVIKMTLLAMYLNENYRVLPCHLFRRELLTGSEDFYDPISFSMALILKAYDKQTFKEERSLFARCFYLRCGLSAFEHKRLMRKAETLHFVEISSLAREEQFSLTAFENWDAASQMNLGKSMLSSLFRFYHDIVARSAGVASIIDRRDITVLGRRIAAIYQKKPNKVIYLPRPTYKLNLKFLDFVYHEDGLWSVFSDSDLKTALISRVDILEAVAFCVWNGFYLRQGMRMKPNASSVTLQEIINLAEKISDVFGSCDVIEREAEAFLRAERITKILVVISFEKNPYEKDINDLAVIYANAWGEWYVHRFYSPFALNNFMKNQEIKSTGPELYYYLQRNASYYEKVIERTKRLTALFLNKNSF